MLEDSTGQGDALKKLEEQRNQALNEVERLKTRDIVRRVAVEEGFIDGDMVAGLIESRVRYNSGNVAGVDGRSINDVLKDVAREKPFMMWDAHPELQRPSFKPNPVQQPAQLTREERDIALAKEIFSADSKTGSEKGNKLAIKDEAEYRRLKAIARAQGFIQY